MDAKQAPTPKSPTPTGESMRAATRTILPPETPPALADMIRPTLTLPEVATWLCLTTEELRAALPRLGLPHFFVEGNVRFRRKTVDRWMREQEEAGR